MLSRLRVFAQKFTIDDDEKPLFECQPPIHLLLFPNYCSAVQKNRRYALRNLSKIDLCFSRAYIVKYLYKISLQFVVYTA